MTWKPNTTYKRIAKREYSRNCAYIYKDGVMLIEHTTARVAGLDIGIDINHYFPGEITIRSHTYKGDGSIYKAEEQIQCKRLVIHNPRALLSGLERVEVSYNSGSEHSREKGIKVTCIRFFCANGMEWEHIETSVISGQVTPQPNNLRGYEHGFNGPDTLSGCVELAKKHFENIKIYGELLAAS